MVPVALTVVLPVVAALCVLRKLTEWSWGKCSMKKSLQGRVFLITGANSGLGKETARLLAERQATVIMACRDMQAAQNAIEDIRRSTTCGNLIPMHLNLASLDSVRSFAKAVLKDFPQIHVLINNAGLSNPVDKVEKTEDGFEIHFGVNYLGHFVLTNLLLDCLRASAPSRVVNVSSLLHRHGKIDFSNLNGEKGLQQQNSRINPAYCNTKLCNVYHAMELGRRTGGSGLEVFVLCPGWCYTGLMRNYSFRWYQYLTIVPIAFFFMRSAYSGAQNILYCATEENLKPNYPSFGFVRNCKLYKSPVDFDPNISAKLWDVSRALVEAKSFASVLSVSADT